MVVCITLPLVGCSMFLSRVSIRKCCHHPPHCLQVQLTTIPLVTSKHAQKQKGDLSGAKGLAIDGSYAYWTMQNQVMRTQISVVQGRDNDAPPTASNNSIPGPGVLAVPSRASQSPNRALATERDQMASDTDVYFGCTAVGRAAVYSVAFPPSVSTNAGRDEGSGESGENEGGKKGSGENGNGGGSKSNNENENMSPNGGASNNKADAATVSPLVHLYPYLQNSTLVDLKVANGRLWGTLLSCTSQVWSSSPDGTDFKIELPSVVAPNLCDPATCYYLAFDLVTHYLYISGAGNLYKAPMINAFGKLKAIGTLGTVTSELYLFRDCIAPTTQLFGPSYFANNSAFNSIYLQANDQETGIYGYQCQVNNYPPSITRNSWCYVNPVQGSNNVTARAIDNAYNLDASPLTVVSFVYDTMPPDFVYVQHQAASHTVRFLATDRTTRVVRYRCRLDQGSAGSPITEPNCTSPYSVPVVLAPTATYTLFVTAFDSAGNSRTMSVLIADEPLISLTPIDPTTYCSLVPVGWNVTIPNGPNYNMVSWNLYLNNTIIRSNTTALSWSTPFNVYLFAVSLMLPTPGFYVLVVTESDIAGRNIHRVNGAWVYSPAILSVTSRPPLYASSTTASFIFNSTCTLGYECMSRNNRSWAACTSPVLLTNLTDGIQTFSVRTIDQQTRKSYSWTVDTTPPVTIITQPPPLYTNARSIVISFYDLDLTPTYQQCAFNSGPWTNCSSPVMFTTVKTYTRVDSHLKNGNYSLAIRSIDSANNVEKSGPVVLFVVDTLFPVAQWISTPAAHSFHSVQFKWMATDTGSGVDETGNRCLLVSRTGYYSNTTADNCTSPKNYSQLVPGYYTFTINIRDLAGNAAVMTYNWTVVAPSASPSQSISPSRTPSPSYSPSQSSTPSISNTPSPSHTASPSCSQSSSASTSTTPSASKSPSPSSSNSVTPSPSPSPAVYAITLTGVPALYSNVTQPVITFDVTPPQLATRSMSTTFVQCMANSGQWLNCTSPLHFTALFVLLNGPNDLFIRIFDYSTNKTQATSTASWYFDNSPPNTVLTPVTNVVRTSSTFMEFIVSATDNTGVPITVFECKLDTNDWDTCYENYTVDNLVDGVHIAKARSTDVTGIMELSPASFTWVVDTTPPTLQFTSRPPVVTNQTTATFTWISADPDGLPISPTFACKLNSVTDTCRSPYVLSQLPEGQQTLTVAASDTLGNTVFRTIGWLVDYTPPTTVLIGNGFADDNDIDNNSTKRSIPGAPLVEYTFTATDALSGVQYVYCKLQKDGSNTVVSIQPCQSPFFVNTTTLTNGTYTVVISAVDWAGNTDPKPIVRNFTIGPLADPNFNEDHGHAIQPSGDDEDGRRHRKRRTILLATLMALVVLLLATAAMLTVVYVVYYGVHWYRGRRHYAPPAQYGLLS
eukprot:TRINITY_DN6760_c0_g1_i2.p1 TRINITY_DN6760_c0_g1~~TRINITY_DN6760_c0_g1_i2.p1  ORF type:complete len:1410 (-),score=138.40 TRINITY_DN6760_c0_g1_i2:70-4299(-)